MGQNTFQKLPLLVTWKTCRACTKAKENNTHLLRVAHRYAAFSWNGIQGPWLIAMMQAHIN